MGFHLLGVCESELPLVYWTGAFFVLTHTKINHGKKHNMLSGL